MESFGNYPQLPPDLNPAVLGGYVNYDTALVNADRFIETQMSACTPDVTIGVGRNWRRCQGVKMEPQLAGWKYVIFFRWLCFDVNLDRNRQILARSIFCELAVAKILPLLREIDYFDVSLVSTRFDQSRGESTGGDILVFQRSDGAQNCQSMALIDVTSRIKYATIGVNRKLDVAVCPLVLKGIILEYEGGRYSFLDFLSIVLRRLVIAGRFNHENPLSCLPISEQRSVIEQFRTKLRKGVRCFLGNKSVNASSFQKTKIRSTAAAFGIRL
jgi:hypothetical protein